ncbi:MAG TPA: cytochrome d ubiquinol oxidase subunit II [Candidatus Binatia bacterium]|nr:cytochrome d ubiquinol oxidase subunit II [Candidatus Binatia bacterium]
MRRRWTDFQVDPRSGILDWYTVLTGPFAVATLTVHGAHYVALKTEGDLSERARRAANQAWWPLVILIGLSLVASLYIRPHAIDNLLRIPGMADSGDGSGLFNCAAALPLTEKDQAAFVASSVYFIATLGGRPARSPILLPRKHGSAL